MLDQVGIVGTLLSKNSLKKLRIVGEVPFVADCLATNRKPKCVADLLPIFDSEKFVFVRLWQLSFEGGKISRGGILVFKTGALNRSAIPPLSASRFDSIAFR